MNKEKWAFLVLRKNWEKRMGVEPENWELRPVDNPAWPDIKTYLLFKTRRTAQRWVNYWNHPEDFEIVAVKLNIDPLGKLIK